MVGTLGFQASIIIHPPKCRKVSSLQALKITRDSEAEKTTLAEAKVKSLGFPKRLGMEFHKKHR